MMTEIHNLQNLVETHKEAITITISDKLIVHHHIPVVEIIGQITMTLIVILVKMETLHLLDHIETEKIDIVEVDLVHQHIQEGSGHRKDLIEVAHISNFLEIALLRGIQNIMIIATSLIDIRVVRPRIIEDGMTISKII